jgi:hypothetical protein
MVMTGRHPQSSCSLVGTPSFSKSPASPLAFAQGLWRGRTAVVGASRSNLLYGGDKGAVREKTQT